jgi:hypothetical protein
MIKLPESVAQDAVWQDVVKQINDELNKLRKQQYEQGDLWGDEINDLAERINTSIAAKLKLIKV